MSETSLEQLTKTLQQQIAQGDIGLALERLRNWLSVEESTLHNEAISLLHNEAISLLARYNHLRSDERRNAITHQEASVEQSRIEAAALDLLKTLARRISVRTAPLPGTANLETMAQKKVDLSRETTNDSRIVDELKAAEGIGDSTAALNPSTHTPSKAESISVDDLTIRITSQGEKFVVTILQSSLPQAGRVYDRPPVPLEIKPLLGTFRYGEATRDEIEKLRDAISLWLLGGGAADTIDSALGRERASRRIVYEIDSLTYQQIADLPLELVTLSKGSPPLNLDPRVASTVYLLPKMVIDRSEPLASIDRLRVLAVRANPAELKLDTPSAQQLLSAILDGSGQGRRERIEVDLLSSDDTAQTKGKPTADELEEAMETGAYHVMVYLGHGNMSAYSAEPTLQLELNNNGQVHPFTAEKLARIVHDNPVSVVLLIACYSAASPSGDKPKQQAVERWMLGIQGIAQNLVNHVAGVQVAVGLRCRMESEDALLYLRAFFRQLVVKRPGYVEHALRRSRAVLHRSHTVQAQAWAAPMIFRASGPEPLFRFTERPPPASTPPTDRVSIGEASTPIDPNSLIERITSMVAELISNIIEPWSMGQKASTDGISVHHAKMRKQDIERAKQVLSDLVAYYQQAEITGDFRALTLGNVERLERHMKNLLFQVKELTRSEVKHYRRSAQLIEQQIDTSRKITDELKKLLDRDTWDNVREQAVWLEGWRGDVAGLLTELELCVDGLIRTTNELLDPSI